MALGKWIGGGLGWILAGPLGALAGFCIGALLDEASSAPQNSSTGEETNGYSRQRAYSAQEQQNAFFFSLMVLSSYIIRADGKVMHSEMEYVRGWLRLNFGEQAVGQGDEILLRLFEEQKQQGPYAFRETIRKSCLQIGMYMNYEQRLQLVHYLIGIARADGVVSPQEIAAIREVAGYMGLSAEDVDSLLNMGSASSSEGTLEEAYKVLGIKPDATDAEVKAAYRKMALKHHPDRVAALGEDVRKEAERKFKEINAAKEKIYEARGL